MLLPEHILFELLTAGFPAKFLKPVLDENQTQVNGVKRQKPAHFLRVRPMAAGKLALFGDRLTNARKMKSRKTRLNI